MLKRLSAPLLVGIALVLFLALGLGIYLFSAADDEAAMTASPQPHPASVTAPPPRRTGTASAPSAGPNLTVALAPPESAVMSQRHWASDADFVFTGHWEHVEHLYDGRSNGSSSRTFRPGSTATLSFYGRFVRLYGVVGPRGGIGTIELDRRSKQFVNFYAASKSVHQVVYASPVLEPGLHHLTLSVPVAIDSGREHGRYVNVNGAEYGL